MRDSQNPISLGFSLRRVKAVLENKSGRAKTPQPRWARRLAFAQGFLGFVEGFEQIAEDGFAAGVDVGGGDHAGYDGKVLAVFVF